jgi:hypothetical protein
LKRIDVDVIDKDIGFKGRQRIWYAPGLRYDNVEEGAVLVAEARQSNSDNHGVGCERGLR